MPLGLDHWFHLRLNRNDSFARERMADRSDSHLLPLSVFFAALFLARLPLFSATLSPPSFSFRASSLAFGLISTASGGSGFFSVSSSAGGSAGGCVSTFTSCFTAAGFLALLLVLWLAFSFRAKSCRSSSLKFLAWRSISG